MFSRGPTRKGFQTPPSRNNVQTFQNRNLFGGTLSELKRLRERETASSPELEDPSGVYRDKRIDERVIWALQQNNVATSNQAFRNFPVRGLIQRSNGKLDKSKKALNVEISNPKETSEIYAVAPEENPAQNLLSEKQYSGIFKEMRRHFFLDKTIFMHDAAVGRSPSADLRVRLLTDHANAGLWASRMLPLVRLDDPGEQTVDLIVYYVPSLKVPNLAQHGVKSDSFAVFDKRKNSVLVAGSESTAVLRNLMGIAAARERMMDPTSGVLPLSCDAVVNSNLESTLIFSADSLFLKKLKPSNLHGAHNNFWGPTGVVPFWSGASLPYMDGLNFKLGDIVEKFPNGFQRATVKLDNANVARSPKNIVFLIEDTRNSLPTISKLTTAQACKHFAAGYNGKTFDPFFGRHLVQGGDAKQLVQTFRDLLDKNKTNVYIINTNVKGQSMDTATLQSLFKSLDEGALATAQTAPTSPFKTLSPVVSVPGLKAALNADTSNATKLEEDLNTFLKTSFPQAGFE